jgi:hypothetical protein
MARGHHSRKRHFPKRLVLTAATVTLAVGSIGGVFANFTDTQAAGPTPISTGQVHIVLGTPAGDHGTLTVGPITNLAAGDTVSRVVQLTNNTSVGPAGSTGLATTSGLTLQTSVAGTNAGSDIVTDTTNGLHVTLQSCPVAPTEAGGTTGPWTYTCSSGFTTVVNSVPLKTLDTTVQDITSSAPVQGATTYYVVTVAVPSAYADSFGFNGGVCSTGGTPGVSEQLQNCSLSVTYNFTATQRTGAAR